MNRDGLAENLRFRIHHTMLPVSNLDRAVEFYTRLLGMTVKHRTVSEARKRAVALVGYSESFSGPFLELTQDLSESAPKEVSPANIHVGIDAGDLRAMCANLEQAGVTFIRPLTAVTQLGSGELRAWIADPDGNQLELAERHST